ncbi:Transferase [Macrophomina phaseolina MS6]|uniref:Transferase n=1 Tax=Macrophomina phaseolina (strain MS6) TaxID=1126212 RepID=K2S184_MACPH|nr:Transferase [Macrophomina phaseolina MS6]
MPASLLDSALLAPPRGAEAPPGRHLLAAQANFIPGGCLLYVSTSHAFVDAFGFAAILDEWAMLCRGIAPPDCDSTSAQLPVALRPPVQPGEYHVLKHRKNLWRALGLDWRPKDRNSLSIAAQLQQAPVRTCTFSFSPAALALLKASASPRAGSGKWISTNDALMALMWRCIVRARSGGRHLFENPDESTLMAAMNVRSKLSPPIPPNHLGNVVLYGLTDMSIDALIAPETPLSTIASAVRESMQRYSDPAFLEDAVKLAASIPDISSLALAFPTWMAENVVPSSLASLPIYDMDFDAGSDHGRPDYFRFPAKQFEGICFVLPRHRNGVVEARLSLEAEHMDRLMADTEFLLYARFVSE